MPKGKIPKKRKPTIFQKLALRELVEKKCEECNKHERDVGVLQPHRMDQNLGYVPHNIKMICWSCHEEFSAAQRIAEGTQK